MNFPKKSRVGEYACYLLLFAVLCLEPRYSAPFAAGLFSALAANGRKPILLAPLYLLSSFAGGLSAAAFFPALFCVAAVIIVRFLCFAIKKPFLVLAAALSAALSQIPTLLFSPVTQDALAYTAVALSLSAFSAYAFSLILRTSFFQNPLTLDGLGADEKISAAILFSALSLGLYGAPLQSHELYLLVSVFFILVFIRRSRYGAGFCLSICAGFAAYLTDGSTMYLVLLCGIAAVSATLRTLSVYLGAVGALGYYVLLSFFSESLAFYPFAAAAIAAGALIAVLIPLKNALDGNVPTAERSIVRNSRLILKRKLTGLESAFSEISVLLRRVSGVTEGNAEQFEGVAGIFKRLEKDFDAGTTFDPVLEQRLIEALSRETVPTQEIAVCGAGNSLRVLIVIDARTARDMFADTARTADTFSRTQNAANGAYYTADYAAKNTRPDDIHTARRTRAADLSVLSRIAAETLGIRLSPPRAEYQKDGSVSIEYRAANRFDVVFGEAHRPKDGISGDVKAALKLGGDKFIAVLSDGMGHGARANSSGENAIALVESFYRAGFTDEIVIPFVNRALCAVSGGVFATLDMCVVDLIDGSVSFVKMGSDDSYIRRKNRVETIENTALPLGASDDASPSVLNKRLDADDFVVLVSDGIANAFNEGGLKDLISQINTKNPQAFADELLKCALYNGVRDDLSVIALRLYRKIGNM